MTNDPTADPTTPVLLAASPGPLRDALHALLLSLPQVGAVTLAGHPAEILQTAAANPPGLVVVIMEAPLTWADLPGKIRAAVPTCRVAVLANGEASAIPADLVLQQGVRPETLVAGLVSLLIDENRTTR